MLSLPDLLLILIRWSCYNPFKDKMRIVVNKHWRVNLDFGRAGSLILQLY